MYDNEKVPESSKIFSLPSNSSPRTLLIIFIGIFLLLSLTFAASRIIKTNPQTNKSDEAPSTLSVKPLNIAPYSLVYGVWNDSNSLIKALDLKSGKQYLLATLPLNIKIIHVLDANTLIYIDKTDDFDMGSQVVRYSLSDKSSIPIITADSGFGIDNILLSPDKTKLVIYGKKS